MKTFLLLLFFPLLCAAQELPDSVSWFRINGKTYYSRDSKGKFIPAVVEYKLAVETAPSLGYTHNVYIRDLNENVELSILLGLGGPQYFVKPFNYEGGKIRIDIDAKNIDEQITYLYKCGLSDKSSGNINSASAKPNPQNNKIVQGQFEGDLYRKVGLLTDNYDCTMKYSVDGYFSAVYASAPERKSKK